MRATRVDLRGAQLTELESGIFDGLPPPYLVLAAGNRLSSGKSLAQFEHREHILGLDASENRIVSFGDAAQGAVLPALQWLDISDNYVTENTLRSAVAAPPFLFALSLAGNALASFEPPDDLAFLHWLDLSRNPLRRMVRPLPRHGD